MKTPLRTAIDGVGGPEAAAKLCGVSLRAVYKWLQKDRLPRTEYTGETRYAETLASNSGDKFDAAWLLNAASPSQARPARNLPVKCAS